MDENKLKKLIIGFAGIAAGLMCFMVYRVLSYFSAYLLNQFHAYSSSFVIIIAGTLTVALTMIMLWRFAGRKSLQQLGMDKFSPSCAGIAIICGLALNMLTISLVAIIPMPEGWIQKNQESVGLLGNCPLWMTIMASYLVAPMVEEIIFRGLLYKAVRNGWGIWAPLIISSALFGFAHGNILQGIYAAVAGAFFAFLLEMTGSFWTAVAAHMVYNIGNIFSSVLFEIVGATGVLIIGIVFISGGIFLTFYSKLSKRRVY